MEKYLQYAWQHKLYPAGGLTDTAGNRVRVLSPGWINHDAGPDFFNAKVVIGSQEWAGNVEVHIKSSDWFRHHHDSNAAYDSVILHVVETADTEVIRRDGARIPQVEIPVTAQMRSFYERLEASGTTDLPCGSVICDLPQLYLTDWLTTLGFERLYQKTARVEGLLRDTNYNWEETLYVLLARGLGFGKNSDQFERLARSLPLSCVRKHRDDLTAIEAMLFGQAGFLEAIPDGNEYAVALRREYDFYERKFGLTRAAIAWQTGRMRPQNMPYRRIALLASVLHHRPNLFSDILGCEGVEDYGAIFRSRLAPFWSSNYSFASWFEPDENQGQALSDASINTLIINVVVPLLHVYGSVYNKPSMSERAVELLERMPAERNSQVTLLRSAGIKCCNSFESQACLQLRREYCEPRKCLYCRIGHRMLRKVTMSH